MLEEPRGGTLGFAGHLGMNRLRQRLGRMGRYVKSLRDRLAWRVSRTEFDPVFYYRHYSDLHHLGSHKEVFFHYRRHGRSEGRLPNERSLLGQEREAVRSGRSPFDIVAYKYHNPDLLEHFEKDAQFLDHFVRHGKAEGRRSSFRRSALVDDASAGHSADQWKHIVSPGEVLAWCGEKLEELPSSRDELLRSFSEQGIAKGWPVSLRYRFDPEFYAAVYCRGRPDDGTYYRQWLEEGIVKGLAPNEDIYLAPFLGGMPYPSTFDWHGYAAHVGAGAAHRAVALAHLFRHGGRAVRRHIRFMGSDAAMLLGRIGRFLLVRGHPRDAIRALREALEREASAPLYALLGEAHAAVGERDAAIEAYRASIAQGAERLAVYLSAANLCCDAGDHAAAFDILRSAADRWRHEPDFDQAVSRCAERHFQHQSAQAHRLLRQGDGAVAEAHRLTEDALQAITSLYLDLDLLPARSGGTAQGHVVMLANDELPQCTRYRIAQKALQFEEAGIALRIFSHRDTSEFMHALLGARAALFYRVGATPAILRAIVHARAAGLQTYYEIDDLIFDAENYPEPFESYGGQIGEEDYAGLRFGVPLFRYALSLCDRAIASTPALAERMAGIVRSGTGLVVRNGLDPRDAGAIRTGAAARSAVDGRIRLFYGSGTKAHNTDFNELAGPALAQILAAHPNAELVIVGYLSLSPEFVPFEDRIHRYPFLSDPDVYWSVLASCHINLAVLHSGPVADCKSEIKWLEAAVLQIPSVVSSTATYGELVTDGTDGYVVETPAQWMERLTTLIVDSELRIAMGAAARAKALEDYSVSKMASQWREEFGGATPVPARAGASKTRILICNVYFHPQSIGGATRVVEDNVRYLVEHCGDLEIGVLCSDGSMGDAGSLRTTEYRGIPVYRMSVDPGTGGDWRAFDARNRAAFERVLDDFMPDLVHFHSIQRLTASIVEATADRGLPYFVTLHDAWWISDHQFLVDEDGFLRLPSADIFGDCRNAPDPPASIERRQKLAGLLHAATARLTVSRAFADIYEAAGISGIRVVPNGVSPLGACARVPREDGRLSLAHIGGRTVHKGAHLIEAILRQEHFDNLHLTMVDGFLEAGRTIETRWGATPVTLIAPVPQGEVSKLYAATNVLLAPSTWPESFGLVAWEATAMGCWVVASNLGAIGEAVEVGRNGYIIDTSSTRDLRDILATMNAESVRYKIPPSQPAAAPRTTEDQARDLSRIYRDMVGHRDRILR